MSEHEQPEEERVASRFYRALPHEEPPAHLDAAILDAARRMGSVHPAPLVAPTGRRSWRYPMAAAAVIVLAVAVTWHVEREEPDQMAALPASPPSPPPVVVPEARTPERKPEGRKAQAANRAEASKPAKSLAKQAQPAPPAVAASPPEASPPEAARQAGAASDAVASGAVRERAERRAQVMAAAEPPEPWLERIAQLRKDGKDDEADKALAEFRKRYPDFRISGEMLKKVEKEK